MTVRKRVILLFFFFSFGPFCLGQTPLKIRVIADYADIRSQPAIDAQVLDVAAKGQTYSVEEKSGAWYRIKLGVDESGMVSYGYLHESMVAPESPPKAEQPPPSPQQVTSSPTVQKPEVIPRNIFAGAFLKFGLGEDRWVASIGDDFGIKRNFALGFELQPYYKDYSEQNLTVLEMNIFANAKAGYKYSSFSVFGGGGIGPNLYYTNAEVGGESETHFDIRLAYHFLAGVALNVHAVAVIFEFQAILVQDPRVDPDPWKYFFLFGLRF